MLRSLWAAVVPSRLGKQWNRYHRDCCGRSQHGSGQDRGRLTAATGLKRPLEDLSLGWSFAISMCIPPATEVLPRSLV